MRPHEEVISILFVIFISIGLTILRHQYNQITILREKYNQQKKRNAELVKTNGHLTTIIRGYRRTTSE